ncbi:hypothetical protein Pan44_37320 [Caulifigura coniformis]|uniref:Uncharacterized protein n=1 Tax=Caulifigura coniformis TaxID=2527983 RepID=A0A517SHT5_9PLAN|nr:hypothetical protein Pan44_37320 [Caulifigura coniformis]
MQGPPLVTSPRPPPCLPATGKHDSLLDICGTFITGPTPCAPDKPRRGDGEFHAGLAKTTTRRLRRFGGVGGVGSSTPLAGRSLCFILPHADSESCDCDGRQKPCGNETSFYVSEIFPDGNARQDEKARQDERPSDGGLPLSIAVRCHPSRLTASGGGLGSIGKPSVEQSTGDRGERGWRVDCMHHSLIALPT